MATSLSKFGVKTLHDGQYAFHSGRMSSAIMCKTLNLFCPLTMGSTAKKRKPVPIITPKCHETRGGGMSGECTAVYVSYEVSATTTEGFLLGQHSSLYLVRVAHPVNRLLTRLLFVSRSMCMHNHCAITTVQMYYPASIIIVVESLRRS